MFAYCNNNPINLVDRSGNNAGWIIAAIVVAMCVTVSLVAEFSMPSKEEHYSRNEGVSPLKYAV